MTEGHTFRERFIRLYGEAEVRTFQAPGRVNIIGEHTDYNQGFVMPAAIGMYTRVAASKTNRPLITVRSENFSETAALNLGEAWAKPRGDWSDYVSGIAVSLMDSGYRVPGANLLIEGDVPLGAGLSSSASLEVAVAFALLALAGINLPLTTIAGLCQRAENDFVGARTGIMDQFASCYGRMGHAMFLDCRNLGHYYTPITEDVRLLIANTMVKHEIAGGEYNVRRFQCEEGTRVLSELLPAVSSLRDVSPQQLQECKEHLDSTIYRRCLHVIEENQRVQDAARALLNHDLTSVGELMNRSHDSLRNNYEVSSDELDLMVDLARKCRGVYGARMTGGGFGGSIISLVEADRSTVTSQAIVEEYRARTGIVCETYICSPVDGAREEIA